MGDAAAAESATTRYNEVRGRYELKLGNMIAYADAKIVGERIIFTHTEVPYELRNCGIGVQLVGAALEDVRRRGLKVVPACWFVSQFIARKPQFKDLLA